MNRSTWIILILTLLIGAWLRTNSIDQIPPGLYHDEAYSGLDALGILRGAGFPIFFEGNGGREPFFIYLHALSVWLFGISPFALRIPAAFLGVLTLAVFFSLVRALAAGSKSAISLALIATAALAVSYWHLNFSRLGWRTISLPLFACLTFYFLWRSRRTNQLRDNLLTGIFLGSSLYTYLSARFLPIVMAIFWLIEAVGMIRARSSPSPWRAWLSRVTLVIGASLVVFLPLAVYFLYNSQAFLFRVSDVTLPSQESPILAVWSNARLVAGAFYQNGDPEWRHGIARRPILDWFVGLPFAIGLAYAIWKWRKPENYFALLWLGIMLLPTVLSRDAPDTQRAIGALPAIYLFVAWGVQTIAEILVSRFRLAQLPITAAMLCLLLLGSGGIAFRDYFVVWANDRHAYDDFQGNLADFARWVNQQSVGVFLPMQMYAEPTFHFLSYNHPRMVRSVLSLDEAERQRILSDPGIVVVSAEYSGGTELLVRNDSVVLLDQAASSDVLDPSRLVPWRDRWGRSFVNLGSFFDGNLFIRAKAASFQLLSADFDHRLDLVGYKIQRNITPGIPFDAEFYWSARKPVQQDISLFIHLLDSQDQAVAGVNEYPANGYRLNLWQPGVVVPDQHRLATDPNLAPGKYAIEVGFYRPSNGSRLPVWVDRREDPDDRVVIAPFKVAAPIDPALLPQNPLAVRFGDVIQLSGYTLDAAGWDRGGTVRMKLFWQALQAIGRDYTVFVHLLDNNSKIIAQLDQQPLRGTYPTSIWDPGEKVQDEITLQVPAGISAGVYKFEMGLYDSETLKRLPLASAASSAPTDALTLPIDLTAGSR